MKKLIILSLITSVYAPLALQESYDNNVELQTSKKEVFKNI